ncbi:MFS transporter [Microbispora rosea subsp. aerata]|nr:MFS transporter [Microbispora rosea]GGO12072.1 MFS transporter [Microbispora rosea subsp. aerata]GIH55646.1 MFS transporter [Microbispora rosea subsp. aerata]GLJ86056.1 MFS transporter [Microbispora rosea subsp. aerata]
MSVPVSSSASAAPRSRWTALAVLCVGAFMIVLDSSVVTVALPAIQDDLGFDTADLAWVVNSYLITFGGMLLLFGRLGDLAGRKNVFVAGLAFFTLASLLCGLADSPALLIGARFAQGVGGAAASAVVLGMVVTMFPEPAEQAKAIGVYSFVQAGGASIGVIAGGALTTGIGWPWIFFVNVPIGVVTLLLAVPVVARDAGAGLREGADVVGAVLVTAGVSLLVYTIVLAAEIGWGAARTLGFGALSVVLLAGFVLRQLKARQPLLRLGVFRSRLLTGANIVMLLLVAGLFAFQFLGALYMQRVLGYSAVQTSLAFLPGPVLIAVMSLGVSPRVIPRFGPRNVLAVGLVLVAAGLSLLARAPVDGTYVVDLLPVMLLMGVGSGLMMPAAIGLAMSGAQPQDAGLASGLVNTTQQVGGAIGLATLATLAAARSEALIASGEAEKVALTAGYHFSFLLSAVLLLAGAVITLTVLRTAKAAPGAEAPAADSDAPEDIIR